MTWTIPNILTVVRLLSAPTVLLAFLFLPRPLADWLALFLFVSASVTDWFDGYLARAWAQQTKLGAMLDPIADKAMVVIALAAVIALMGMSGWVILPATVILFREIFVSGLREFLGDTAGTLKVTQLAKWKTTIQMVAISVLLFHGVAATEFGDAAAVSVLIWVVGVALLWVAAALTFVTGLDYFTKALPYLKD